MQLTPRAAEVIALLARQPADYPLTLAAASEQLGVSRRTLQRVLPEVKSWMDAHGYRFSSRTGVGLSIDEPDDRRREIASASAGLAQPTGGRGRTTRARLTALLLDSDEPYKLAWLARQCDLSEGTLEKELDELADWFDAYGMTLRRKAGVGVYLEGGEDARRLAIEAAITAFTDPADLLRMLEGQAPVSENVRLQLPGLIPPDEAESVRALLEEAENRLDVRLTDSAFIGLFVHIALAVQRVRSGNLIQMEPDRLARLRLLPEYAVAEYVSDRLNVAFSLALPPDETGFITMHLAGSRVWRRDPADKADAAELDILHLTLAMTAVMESELGMVFRDSDTLIEGLCNHLYAVAGRLRNRTPIDNPQLDAVRRGYPDLFAATRKACSLLERETGTAVPDAEVAYVAVHFGAVLEEKQNRERQITAVVVCPTGVGTSRLLAAELRRTYPDLLIEDVLPAMRLDADDLRSRRIDLIISTMELSIKFRYIQVSPIPTERDRILLGAALDAIRRQKSDKPTVPTPPRAVKPLTLRDVAFIRSLSRETLELSANVRCRQAPVLRGRGALLSEAARLFADSETGANDIELAFLRRDQISDTYIKPFRALLLHCRTSFTAHCRLGYIRLEPPFYEMGRIVLGAIVLLLPEDDPEGAGAALMSEISGLLLRRPALLGHMRAGDETALTDTLTHELMDVYRSLILKRLGGESP